MGQPLIVIDGNKKWYQLGLKEIWLYRDLFLVLAYRDLRVRYAQTLLGLLWAILQPAATLVIFSLIFSSALAVDTGHVPYPVYAMSGMMVWNYFAFVMAQSGQSVIGAQEMVKKIYFPRLILPLSKAVVGFVDMAVSVVLLFVLFLVYRSSLDLQLLWFCFYFFVAIICALSVGIWLSALTVRFRDFQHVVPFMVQFGLYATPIAYPVTLIPERYQLLFHLNPMAGVVEGVRWSLFGGITPHPYSWVSFGVVALLFVSSLFYFRHTERVMADII